MKQEQIQENLKHLRRIAGFSKVEVSCDFLDLPLLTLDEYVSFRSQADLLLDMGASFEEACSKLRKLYDQFLSMRKGP